MSTQPRLLPAAVAVAAAPVEEVVEETAEDLDTIEEDEDLLVEDEAEGDDDAVIEDTSDLGEDDDIGVAPATLDDEEESS